MSVDRVMLWAECYRSMYTFLLVNTYLFMASTVMLWWTASRTFTTPEGHSVWGAAGVRLVELSLGPPSGWPQNAFWKVGVSPIPKWLLWSPVWLSWAVTQTVAKFELHFPAADSLEDQEGPPFSQVVGRDLEDRKTCFVRHSPGSV